MTAVSKATFNVLFCGIGLFFRFLQIYGRGNIQEAVFATATTANKEGFDAHAGYRGLAVVYLVFTFGNLFTPPIIDRIGAKWALTLGAILTVFLEAGFFHLNVYYYYAASVLAGFGASLVYPALGTYVAQNSTEKTAERNSSIIWALWQSSQLAVGIIMFLIFVFTSTNATSISEETQLWTTICFTIFLIFSVFVFATLRSSHVGLNLPSENEYSSNFLEEMAVTFKLMFTKKLLLLGLVFAHTGILQSFWTVIFPTTIGFTSKLADKPLLFVAFGAVASGIGRLAACGWIAAPWNRLNRRQIVLIGFVLNLAVFGGIYLWFPADASLGPTPTIGVLEPSIFVTLLLSFLLGIGDSCWNVEIFALIVDVFPHCTSPAFALFSFYQSLLSSAALFYAPAINLIHHLIILTISSILAIICFYLVDGKGKEVSFEEEMRDEPVELRSTAPEKSA